VLGRNLRHTKPLSLDAKHYLQRCCVILFHSMSLGNTPPRCKLQARKRGLPPATAADVSTAVERLLN
jgi:hypothetical protein